MSSLKLQRRLAASVLGVGKRALWLDPTETAEIALANSREFSFFFARRAVGGSSGGGGGSCLRDEDGRPFCSRKCPAFFSPKLPAFGWGSFELSFGGQKWTREAVERQPMGLRKSSSSPERRRRRRSPDNATVFSPINRFCAPLLRTASALPRPLREASYPALWILSQLARVLAEIDLKSNADGRPRRRGRKWRARLTLLALFEVFDRSRAAPCFLPLCTPPVALSALSGVKGRTS